MRQILEVLILYNDLIGQSSEEEKGAEEKEFNEDTDAAQVEPTQNEHVENAVSHFIAENKTWEAFGLSEDLLANIHDTLGGKPSKV